MAPRRGGGSSISSGGSGGGGSSSTYYYDPDLIISQSVRTAMFADFICAVVLLAATMTALIMVGFKSWLRTDSRRNKSRLIMFILCLLSLLASRSLIVTNTVLELQGPNDINRLDYYATLGFVSRPLISSFFDLISSILFFILVLFELTRGDPEVERKRSVFEILNLIIIFILFGVSLSLWVLDTRRAIQIYNDQISYGDYFTNMYAILRILALIYTGLALIFAIVMVIKASSASSKSTEPLLKSRLWRIRMVTKALLFGQALYLASVCIGYFVNTTWAATIVVALSAAGEVMWTFKVLGLAFLARSSHKLQLAGLTYKRAPSLEQTTTQVQYQTPYNDQYDGQYHNQYGYQLESQRQGQRRAKQPEVSANGYVPVGVAR